MRDYLLITHPPAGKAQLTEESFAALMRNVVAAVRRTFPDIEWQADFVLDLKYCIEVFSAPDIEAATRVSELVSRVAGVRAEVIVLRSRW